MLTVIEWKSLTNEQKKTTLTRPSLVLSNKVKQQVNEIIASVKKDKDRAVKDFTQKYDSVDLKDFRVSVAEIESAKDQVSEDELKAITFAYNQIYQFHKLQIQEQTPCEISEGIFCIRKARPISQVGLYVPGGEASLPSTVLMLGVPAKIAGCELRIMCTPPRRDGTVDPYILVAAQLCGITQIYKIGGAQAIAAMAYGTESVPKVEKIFGPGNTWVTASKLVVMQDLQGANCDLPAGPSELLIIADKNANADFIAADLLSQAEHSSDAQVILITDSKELADKVIVSIRDQLAKLSRQEIISKALTSAKIFLIDNLLTAFSIANEYAPEHLSLQVEDPKKWFSYIRNAGAVFIGEWTPQTLGDYVMGTNHVLPTNGFSKVYSGLSVSDFMKFINFQQVSMNGLKEIGQHAITLADIEQLDAHKNAVAIRLRQLQ